MANYKDPGHNQGHRDADALSALYQASKNTDETAPGKNGDEPYIPEEIDLRILQAAKKAVTPVPGKVSFLRRRWDIPVSVAATILLSTLLFIDVKDEIPFPDNQYLPKPSIDSSLLQEKEAEQVKSPTLKSADQSRTRELSEQQAAMPESKNSSLNEKDAAITDLPSSFSAEKLSKQEAAKIITTMPADRASPLIKQIEQAKKSVHQPAGLSAPVGDVLNRSEPSPPMTPSLENYKNKSNKLQVPAEQKPSDNSGQSTARSDLADDTGLPIKPSSREQWLKDIEQLLEENKVVEANLSLDSFRSTYPEYRLDNFCAQHKRLTCQ